MLIKKSWEDFPINLRVYAWSGLTRHVKQDLFNLCSLGMDLILIPKPRYSQFKNYENNFLSIRVLDTFHAKYD